jgi:hypothetical protein
VHCGASEGRGRAQPGPKCESCSTTGEPVFRSSHLPRRVVGDPIDRQSGASNWARSAGCCGFRESDDRPRFRARESSADTCRHSQPPFPIPLASSLLAQWLKLSRPRLLVSQPVLVPCPTSTVGRRRRSRRREPSFVRLSSVVARLSLLALVAGGARLASKSCIDPVRSLSQARAGTVLLVGT